MLSADKAFCERKYLFRKYLVCGTTKGKSQKFSCVFQAYQVRYELLKKKQKKNNKKKKKKKKKKKNKKKNSLMYFILLIYTLKCLNIIYFVLYDYLGLRRAKKKKKKKKKKIEHVQMQHRFRFIPRMRSHIRAFSLH